MECLSCGNSTDSIFTACPRCGAKHIRAYGRIVATISIWADFYLDISTMQPAGVGRRY